MYDREACSIILEMTTTKRRFCGSCNVGESHGKAYILFFSMTFIKERLLTLLRKGSL